jgi:hypothetical protein
VDTGSARVMSPIAGFVVRIASGRRGLCDDPMLPQSSGGVSSFLIPDATTSVRLRAPAPLR